MPPDLHHYATWQIVLAPESTAARTYNLPIQLSVVYSPLSITQALLRADRPALVPVPALYFVLDTVRTNR
ncbi:hypothetical protein [Nitrosospira sp. NRS527]|uniref:hypothetical protein n=1 Tax=Nitrosospira sp. NRS527 TaxID=155925 RepID=UPI001AF28AAC|nr:hypothetical protein [Nitrosospira sp. NRS527]BCT68116.1 hypothetical protein NNRS527_01708 [Nitrosospira sp. NRS527]